MPRGRLRPSSPSSSSPVVRSGSRRRIRSSMGDAIRRALAAVRPVDAAVAARTRNTLDAKAKPRGSLGRLEDVAVRLTTAGGRRPLRPVIGVAAADHGVAARGVSAYPQQVTRQMVAALADDAAAVCVLARQAGAALVVVDAGIAEPLADARVLDLRLGPGTGDFTVERAMGI